MQPAGTKTHNGQGDNKACEMAERVNHNMRAVWLMRQRTKKAQMTFKRPR
jgi:hypothetical protein